MPDPKIKPVIAEIEAVLKKHDMAGIVFVASKSHTQFLYHLFPKWGCITPQDDGGIRIRAKSKDPAQVEALRLSIGMIAGFSDAMGIGVKNMNGLLAQLSNYTDISHTSTAEDYP